MRLGFKAVAFRGCRNFLLRTASLIFIILEKEELNLNLYVIEMIYSCVNRYFWYYFSFTFSYNAFDDYI